MRIAVLGVAERSNYHKLHFPGHEIILFDKAKDMRNFQFDSPVIAHPPCAQWSRCRNFAYDNPEEKALAFFCLQAVQVCGGILEHPHGSQFMREFVGFENCISVDQHWWHFPARKRTLLYFSQVKPLSFPLNFDAIKQTSYDLRHDSRSRTTIEFNTWLINCIIHSPVKPPLA